MSKKDVKTLLGTGQSRADSVARAALAVVAALGSTELHVGSCLHWARVGTEVHILIRQLGGQLGRKCQWGNNRWDKRQRHCLEGLASESGE